MAADHSSASRTLKLLGFGVLAFAITTLAGGIWSALLVTNLRTTPAIPWSVPAMAVLLWLAWSYLGGKGPPRSTSEARRRYLRASRRSARTYMWAWIAGGFVSDCAGRILDCALPIGEDAAQRALRCVGRIHASPWH